MTKGASRTQSGVEGEDSSPTPEALPVATRQRTLRDFVEKSVGRYRKYCGSFLILLFAVFLGKYGRHILSPSCHDCFTSREGLDEALRAWRGSWLATTTKSQVIDVYRPVEDWCFTSNVTDMSKLFFYSEVFNEDIRTWNVSAVMNMEAMFWKASAFNQPLNYWDVSNVKNMGRMFYMASSFDQPLDRWDTSSVEEMRWMFYNAFRFNQPLNSWNISSVNDTSYMFAGAMSFNQSLDAWDVSSVKNMKGMFGGASSFDQNFCRWRDHLSVDILIPDSNKTKKMFQGTSCPSQSPPDP